MKKQTHTYHKFKILPLVSLLVLLVAIPFTLYTLFHARSARAEWFNSAWSYRKSIRFGNTGSAVTDQKVLIAFDTATPIAAGKMQSSCQDVRFTDAGGKLLQYYLDVSGGAGTGCNDASSDFYVLMPSIVAGNNLMYIYYGQPSALAGTVSSNFDNTTFSPTSGPTTDVEEQSPGPVAVWHMDEGQGSTATDASGHGNSLTLTSTAWATQSATLSNRTQYLQFNGATSVASRANDTEFDVGTGSFSISAWIRHSSNITGTDVLITKYNTQGWKVYMNSSGFICFGIDDDSSYGPDDSACTTTSYADSQWHHIEVVKQGTTSITVYVDGNQKAQTTSLTATATLSTTATLYIGADSAGNTNWWDGWVDDVAIYPYARTASQVKLDILGSSEASRSGTLIGAAASDTLVNGLVGYWNMDENTGQTVSDLSGNANNATLGATASVETDDPTWSSGKFGSGVLFDGINDTFRIPDSDNYSFGNGTTDTSFSVSVWVNTNDTTGVYIAEKSNEWLVRLGSDGRLICALTDTSTAGSIGRSYSSGISQSAWHLVQCTYDGSQSASGIKIYVDGVRRDDSNESSGTYVAMENTGNSLRISDTEFLNGYVDEMRVYTRTLSQSEIRQLYAWAPGPVAHWKLDEKTGSAANDTSGNTNNSTTWTGDINWRSGKYGSALAFDGDNDVIRFAETASTDLGATTDSYTVSAWFKTTAQVSGASSIINKNQTGTEPFSIYLNFSERACMSVIGTGGTQVNICGNTALHDGSWHHVVGKRDVTLDTIYLYVDGIQVNSGTDTTTGSVGNDNDISLGNSGTSYTEYDFNGTIDDVRIYNYARTQSQIIEDMNGGHPAPGGNVGSAALHLKFDDGYGDSAYDSSPNRIPGDLAGTSGSCPGAANCPTWYTSGKLNAALDFDGNNDYVAIVDNPIFDVTDTDDITISGWFNRDTTGTEDTIIAKRNSLAAVDVGWIVSVRDTDVFDFQLSDGTDEYQMTTTQTFTSTGWNFFTVIWDQDSTSNSKIFINGKQVPITTTGTIGNVGDTSNALDLRVGTHSDGSDRFDGKIDDIRLYKSTIPDSQALVLYNQGASTVMGAVSTDASGNASWSAADSYCPPGQGTACTPPVGHWKLDENGGTSTVYDSSGNGRDGTMTNLSIDDWVRGKYGPALDFDNADDKISIADNDVFSINTTNQFTVEAWFNPSDLTLTQEIVNKGSGGIYEWAIRINGDGSLLAYVYTAAGGDYLVTPFATTLQNNTWYHLAMTVDLSAPSLKLYQNGRIIAEDTTSSGSYTNGTAAVRIGERADGLRDVDGIIDDVRIYNYVRTPAQVAWDYNRGKPTHWYTFDECQGTTVYNQAPNASGKAAGMNGTITIGATGTYTSAGTCGSGTSTESWNGGTTGKFGASLAVDATNDYMSVTDTTALDFTTEVTVSGWIYSDVLPTTSVKDANIVNKYITATNQRAYKLIVDKGDNKYYFLVDGDGASGSTAIVASDVTFTTGAWHHVVGIFQNSTVYIYVDGVLQTGTSTGGFSTIFNSSADLVIGMDANKTSAANSGKYDDIMLFNYAMTAAQVKMLYNQGSAVRFGP